MIQFNLQDVYLLAIKNGLKTTEGRIAKDKYLSLKKGDEIIFKSNDGDEQIIGRVVAVNKYSSFDEMLKEEGIATMLPGTTNLEEGVSIYSSFGTYAEDVKRYGCVAISFELS